jgi:hypothetical protein
MMNNYQQPFHFAEYSWYRPKSSSNCQTNISTCFFDLFNQLIKLFHYNQFIVKPTFVILICLANYIDLFQYVDLLNCHVKLLLLLQLSLRLNMNIS